MVCKIVKLCPSCEKEVTINNYEKHYLSCQNKKPPKVRGIDFDPNWGYKDGSRVVWNKGLNKATSEAVAEQSLKQKLSYSEGKRKPSGAATFSKEKLSRLAKERGFGGYREGSGRSKKFKVCDSYGREVTLQSSYELQCSVVLDELELKWTRPSYLPYGEKKYFPDFFLVDYQVYLDPKNNFLKAKDQEKIQKVINQNNVKIFVLGHKEINKEYIRSLLTCSSEERAKS